MKKILVLSTDTDRSETFLSLVQSVFPEITVDLVSPEELEDLPRENGSEARQGLDIYDGMKGGGL